MGSVVDKLLYYFSFIFHSEVIMTNKLSPSKLKPSLLLVLGGLVASPADFTQLDDMVTAFCTHHSIEESDWGYMTSQKNPRSWVRYNITKAFTKLREEGLGEAKGRGKYGLTAEGIAKAKENGIYKGGKSKIDVERIKTLRGEGMGATKIAKEMKIHRDSVYRLLKKVEA